MPRTGRPPKYPWDTWLDGEHRLLLPGRDFEEHVNLLSLRQQAYAAAAQRDKKVTVAYYGEGLSVRALAGAEQARRGRAPIQDWPTVFSKVGLADFEEVRDFPRGKAAAFQETMRRAALRHGAVIKTRHVGGRVTCNVLQAVELAEKFPPPILIDEGIDEDSVFEPVDHKWEVECLSAALAV